MLMGIATKIVQLCQTFFSAGNAGLRQGLGRSVLEKLNNRRKLGGNHQGG